MNNFINSLKKFLKNKNTVTVIGVMLILGILYWGYSSKINSEVEPINVPVAKNKIGPGRQIKSSDVEYVNVAKIMVGGNILRNSNQIVGKYTNLNVTIPKNSMFYKEWIVNEKQLPGKWINNIDFEEGQEAYYLNVNAVATYGNSVVPDSYIDIYMKAADENGLVMYGKLLENIKVLVVHNSQGQDVFGDPEQVKQTNYLGFAVSQEYYLLLKKAQYLNNSGIDIVIAPHGTELKDLGDVAVRSEDLRDYIEARTARIDTDEILSQEQETATQTE